MNLLYKAFSSIKTEDEFNAFLKDICTPKEIKDLNERIEIASILSNEQKSYRDVASKVGCSLTTVTRVARFLKDEPYHGYKQVLEHINKHHRG